jgi:hypothetical protein
MQHLFARLPRFARPFVTRALRGPRAARFSFLALVLALASVLASVWLAFGAGAFEQQVRIGMAIEDNPAARRVDHFVVTYRDPWLVDSHRRDLDALLELAASGHLDAYALNGVDFELRSTFIAAHTLLDRAASRRPLGADATPANEARWREAVRLRTLGPVAAIAQVGEAMREFDAPSYNTEVFAWDIEHSLARLDRAIAMEGIPRVELYTAPTTVADAFRMLAYVSAAMLAFLSLLVLPVMTGTQTAQEVGDGTLAPLRSTALSSREIVLGLASGPLAILAILAAPQIGLYLVGAAIAGNAAAGLVALAAMALLAAVSTLLAQLVGLLVGHQRSPGLIAIPLAALASLSLLVGTGLSQVIASEDRASTLLAACPQANVASWAFLGAGGGPATSEMFFASTGIGLVVMAVFAVLTLFALERRVSERPGALLRPVEYTLIAVVTFTATTWAMIPGLSRTNDSSEAAGLAMMLAIPVLLIGAMGRVPVGDPSARASYPLLRGLGELSLPWLVAFGALGAMGIHMFSTPLVWPWLLWCVVVLQLVAVRSVIAPVGVAGGALLLWTVFTAMVAVAEVGVRAERLTPHLFMFSELSPMLGALEGLSLIAVPLLLLAGVRAPHGRRA